MLRRFLTVAVTASCLAAAAGGETGDRVPVSPFVETAVHGTALGAFTGLAWGWVRYADRHEMQHVWESVGYGAAAGLGAGTAAALVGKDGGGNRALNDIDAVGGFGGATGFMAGVVSALFTGDSRQIADGMAWGQLAGVALGIGVAGYKIAAHKYGIAEEQPQEQPLQCSVGFIGDSAALMARRRF